MKDKKMDEKTVLLIEGMAAKISIFADVLAAKEGATCGQYVAALAYVLAETCVSKVKYGHEQEAIDSACSMLRSMHSQIMAELVEEAEEARSHGLIQ